MNTFISILHRCRDFAFVSLLMLAFCACEDTPTLADYAPGEETAPTPPTDKDKAKDQEQTPPTDEEPKPAAEEALADDITEKCKNPTPVSPETIAEIRKHEWKGKSYRDGYVKNETAHLTIKDDDAITLVTSAAVGNLLISVHYTGMLVQDTPAKFSLTSPEGDALNLNVSMCPEGWLQLVKEDDEYGGEGVHYYLVKSVKE